MNSTEEKLRAFYTAQIAPLQGKVPLRMKDTGVGGDSYYINRSEDEAVQMAFGETLTTPQAVGAELDRMWAGTALSGLGARLADLSGQIDTPEDTGKVSDQIYEMF